MKGILSSNAIWGPDYKLKICRRNFEQHIEANSTSIMWSAMEGTDGAVLVKWAWEKTNLHRSG